ncbi:MAG: cytochrome b/b6 domain-containing protein [Thermodesulfobacteriota bacterium]
MEHNDAIYIHPTPVRIWHWINALAFLVLIATGTQIRFPELLGLFSLESAVKVHNYTGFLLIANYLLWLFFYLGTGKVRVYFPNFRAFTADTLRQAQYYGYGIFKGEPNPHVMTPENKFNPMQQQAYLGIMFLLLPAQIASGFFLWRVRGFENYITLLGGVKIVATIHVLLFFFFTAFIIVHCYLATLGHTPLAHFKAMITGYEEHH